MKRVVGLIVVLLAVGVVTNGCQKQKTTTPSGDKSLTLTKPGNQSVTQGSNDNVKVSISRKGFNDAVTVDFKGLPEGVSVEEKDKTIPKEHNDANFTLKASDTAKVGDHPVVVHASGGGLDAEEKFTLTVKEKSK